MEEQSSEEDEETVVEYMDSDEDKKKKKVVEVGRTEEEEEHVVPPMQDWVPVDRAQSVSFLSFRPVVLPSSSASVQGGLPVRSTVVGKFGRSVVVGPAPRVLKWEERHSSGAMMMVSPDQLRAHLSRHATRFNNQNQRRVQTGRRAAPARVTDTGLDYELQAAVTPWIGNLLIPAKSRVTVTDAVRERAEKTGLSSTPVFLLFLRLMCVDATGCKEVIEQRKKGGALLTPPPDPASVEVKNLKTVAGMLQQRELTSQRNHNQTSVPASTVTKVTVLSVGPVDEDMLDQTSSECLSWFLFFSLKTGGRQALRPSFSFLLRSSCEPPHLLRPCILSWWRLLPSPWPLPPPF